jgi:hypothetical protein
MEAAAGGRFAGAGLFPFDQRPLACGGADLQRRRGGQERAGVGMLGRGEQGGGVAHLHQLAQVHDPDPVADVPDHRQVVRDEEVG